MLGQQRGLALGLGQRHIDDEHRPQISLARIKTALEDVQRGNVAQRKAQRLRRQLAQRGLGMRRRRAVSLGFVGGIRRSPLINGQGGQGKFEFRKTNHGDGLVVIKQGCG